MTLAPDAIADSALITLPAPAPAQILTVRILHLDGRLFASAGFLPPYMGQWDWICETIAREYDCDMDDVGCIETDDGDRITVEGVPLFYTDLGS